MKKKIVLIKGVYDTIDLFTDEIEQALEEMNFQCLVLDANHMEESLKEFAVFALTPVTAAITFNNLGYNLEFEEGVNIWEQFEIPYVNILMDHPFHYSEPLAHMPTTTRLFCTDKNHVTFIKRYFGDIARVGFLPHAGAEGGFWKKRMDERKIDVLYAGALPFFTAGRLVPDLSAITQFDAIDMSRQVLKELICHPAHTTEEAVEQYLNARSIFLEDGELLNGIVKMRFLDSYATSFFREQAVRLLVESGVDVTVYGMGWNECEWSKNPHFHYGGKVPATQILPMMGEAKIVLNTMTWYKAGAHDRIFNGMLANACVVTDDSGYLKEQFEKREQDGPVRFQLEKMQELPELVFILLEHQGELQRRADCGYRMAREEHTWKNRLETILEELGASLP